MYRSMLVGIVMFFAIPVAVSAQASDAELNARVTAAQADDADARDLIVGAAAARLLGNQAVAGELLEQSIAFMNGAENACILAVSFLSPVTSCLSELLKKNQAIPPQIKK